MKRWLSSRSNPQAKDTSTNQSPTKWDRVYIVSAAVIALVYVISALLLQIITGNNIPMLSAIPIILIGWFFGIRVGMAAGIIGMGLNILWALPNQAPWDAELWVNTIARAFALVVIGAGSGYWGTLQKQIAAQRAQRRQAEQALSSKEQQFQNVVAQNVDGMIVIGENGEIQFANPAACALFNRESKDLLGIQLGLPLVTTESIEVDLPRANGETGVAEMRVVEIEWEGRKAHLASLRDITERKRTQKELAQFAAELQALYDTISEINSKTETTVLFQAIVQRAAILVHAPISALYLKNPQTGELELFTMTPDMPLTPHLEIDHRLITHVACDARPYALDGNTSLGSNGHGTDGENENRIQRALAAPMIAKGQTIGVIAVADLAPGKFDNRMLRLLELFADQAAIALENARLYAAIRQMAITDDLTGLYNRRGFFQLARREFERADRSARPLSVILLDIDHFKLVNDEYGHAIGDQVLHDIAETCQKHVRSIDVIGRYGGEELIVLLPDADLTTACIIAERLRQAISETQVQIHQSTPAKFVRITASMGIASKDHNIEQELDQVIKQADALLYVAKQSGRNTIVTTNLVAH